MDNETLQMICIIAGVALGMAGGKWWKGLRRYVMFVVFLTCGALAGGQSREILVYSALWGSFSAHLPYGERTPYWLKAVVGVLIANSTSLMGFTAWQGIGSVAFILTFILSNNKKYAREFFWKVCEAIVWGCVGVSWARLIV